MTKEKAWKILKSQFFTHPVTKQQKQAIETIDDVMRYEIIREKKYLEQQRKVRMLLSDEKA